MNLPTLKDLDFEGKGVLLRADLDIDLELGEEDLRIKTLLPTIEFLAKKSEKIVIIAHRGRPAKKKKEKYSLKPIADILRGLVKARNVELMENLRFDEGEEKNDEHFAEHIAGKGEVFVNEAFASSHRKHASIVTLPKLMPHAAGLRFEKEVENLSRVLESPKKPLVVILGGAKEDKTEYVEEFKKIADKILVGGRLPEYMDEDYKHGKVVVGKLIQDKEDMTIHTIEMFEEEVKKAGTIVLAGPMSKFEENGHLLATERIFKAIAKSSAFKVVGGGDTYVAIKKLSLEDKFDWISVGGGATLEFLSKGTLPGIDALLN
jgi:phosphoglycerate kinase